MAKLTNKDDEILEKIINFTFECYCNNVFLLKVVNWKRDLKVSINKT